MNKEVIFDWRVLYTMERKNRLGYPRRGTKRLIKWMFYQGWKVSIIAPTSMSSYFSTGVYLRHFNINGLPRIKVYRTYVEIIDEVKWFIPFIWFAYYFDLRIQRLHRKFRRMLWEKKFIHLFGKLKKNFFIIRRAERN